MERDLATLRLTDHTAALHGSHIKAGRKFGSLLVNGQTDETLFAPGDVTVEYVDSNYLSRPGTHEVLWDLYRHVLAEGKIPA